MADTAPPQDEPKPRLPVELCERVIDAAYEENYYLVPTALAALSSCALVCRAWRAPAQKVLFEFVLLRDKAALYRFAALLDASPELGGYVRQVELRGYLHVPNSPVVSFPAVLGARLTGLSQLHISELADREKRASPLPEGVKELPSLPLHRFYLPSLLASGIARIRSMFLYNLVFPSFGDFARILDTLPRLLRLSCQEVSWAVLGQEPWCMAQGRSRGSQQTFLPHLTSLRCTYVDVRGTQRLLGALGPSLRELDLKFPSSPVTTHMRSSAAEEQDVSSALDLQAFPQLDKLSCYLAPFWDSLHGDSAIEALQETLLSWVASDACGPGDSSATQGHRVLSIHPYGELFRREEFVQLLRVVGAVVEAALCSAAPPDAPGNAAGGDPEDRVHPCWATVVVEDLGDSVEWSKWWETRVRECFPTFARWNQLTVFAGHNVHPAFRWIDYDQTPENLQRTCTHSPAMPLKTAEGATSAE